jgi:hypothetical protein
MPPSGAGKDERHARLTRVAEARIISGGDAGNELSREQPRSQRR